jgi:hypothetical protein
MWSDVVLQIERLHVLRLLFWAAASVVAGTALLVMSVAQGRGSTLIRHFAGVCAALGAAELILGAIEYQRLALRDLAGATRLERVAWLQVGLYLGMAAVGLTMWVISRRVASRAHSPPEATLPTVGGGIAVALHGLALATLQLLLVAAISR